MKDQKVTIYSVGAFGLDRMEAKLIEHGRKQHAQYNNAPYVHYVQKGKRKPEGRVNGDKPTWVILEGWEHPDLDKLEILAPGMSRTKYGCFDPRYTLEANQFLNEYLKSENVKVVADYRYTTETENEELI